MEVEDVHLKTALRRSGQEAAMGEVVSNTKLEDRL